eukprot:m.39760 g.39760  ORF g.39760 m.39760 type:complete len:546 (+) comp18281_c0_seq1:303-1940(+)
MRASIASLGVATTLLLVAVISSAVGSENRVTDLLNSNHYFDLVRDTPYVHRPPSLLAFFSETDDACMRAFNRLEFNENGLPSRQHVFLGRYDVDKQYDFAWFKFTDELNLAGLLEVQTCPTLVILPPEYTGRENKTKDFHVWNNEGNWRDWAIETISKYPVQRPSEDFTNKLLLTRDDAETRCHYRICITPAKIPSYTDRGFKLMDMSDELYERLLNYYETWKHKRSSEPWDLDQTETNYHETHMSLVSLDHDWQERDAMAHELVKPLLAEWADVPAHDLKLKSFYGIREYYRGNELRTHIDVINTHVLSAVLCIAQEGIDEDWMLEVIDHFGERVEIACKAKQIILYESASLPHGRPKPFKGEKFMNAFVHFQPEGWDFVEHTWGVASSPTNFQGPFGLGRGDGVRMRRNADGSYDDDEEEDNYEDEVLSHDPYGDDENIPAPPKIQDDGKRKATFINGATSPRDLWWEGADGVVFQAYVEPGKAVEMNSFVGHKFVWSSIANSKDTGEPSSTNTLRGSKIGDSVVITKDLVQTYTAYDTHDEL